MDVIQCVYRKAPSWLCGTVSSSDVNFRCCIFTRASCRSDKQLYESPQYGFLMVISIDNGSPYVTMDHTERRAGFSFLFRLDLAQGWTRSRLRMWSILGIPMSAFWDFHITGLTSRWYVWWNVRLSDCFQRFYLALTQTQILVATWFQQASL